MEEKVEVMASEEMKENAEMRLRGHDLDLYHVMDQELLRIRRVIQTGAEALRRSLTLPSCVSLG